MYPSGGDQQQRHRGREQGQRQRSEQGHTLALGEAQFTTRATAKAVLRRLEDRGVCGGERSKRRAARCGTCTGGQAAPDPGRDRRLASALAAARRRGGRARRGLARLARADRAAGRDRRLRRRPAAPARRRHPAAGAALRRLRAAAGVQAALGDGRPGARRAGGAACARAGRRDPGRDAQKITAGWLQRSSGGLITQLGSRLCPNREQAIRHAAATGMLGWPSADCRRCSSPSTGARPAAGSGRSCPPVRSTPPTSPRQRWATCPAPSCERSSPTPPRSPATWPSGAPGRVSTSPCCARAANST